MRRPHLALTWPSLLAAVVALLSGCGGAPAPGGAAGARVTVVAAENFWGSIATQLAGDRGLVQSIVVDPGTDPHAYQPTAQDARTLATAQLAIVNGVGYDPWAPQLLGADPAAGRTVLDVGSLLGLHKGDNPHRWYSPADVSAVAASITADLQRLAPRYSAYFAARLAAFLGPGLSAYHAAIARIRGRYAGVRVGASESIFAALAPALGLDLVTPPGFMKAISEGTDPTAADKSTADAQIAGRGIAVWVYNAQNATPDVQRLTDAARAARLPIVTITETLSPASETFQGWQTAQLLALARALHQATGR